MTVRFMSGFYQADRCGSTGDSMLSLRVLIVEDDAVSATLHKAMLESEGHKVVAVARTERDALDVAKNLMPDAVLMDICLEDGLSGVHAAKKIYSLYALPVIFITGGTAAEQLNDLVSSDAFALIKKPVSLEELRVNLSIVMRREEEMQRIGKQCACCNTLIDLLPVPIFSVKKDGRLDWCNSACASMLGFSYVGAFCEHYDGVWDLVALPGPDLLVIDTHTPFVCGLFDSQQQVVQCTLEKLEHPLMNVFAERSFFVVT